MKISPLLRTGLLVGSLLAPASFVTKSLTGAIVCCPNTDNQQPGSPVIPPEPEDGNLPYDGNDETRDRRQANQNGPGDVNAPLPGTSGGPGNQNGPGVNVCCPQQ